MLRKHIGLDFLLFSHPFHQYQVKYVYPRFSEILRKPLKPQKPFFNKTWILISSPPFAKYTPVYLHTPLFAKYTPIFIFFDWFLPETCRNFTDYTTILFLTFGMLRIFTNCTTMFVLISGMLRDFTDYTMMGVKHFWGGQAKVACQQIMVPGWN